MVAVRLQAGETEEAFSALTEALRIASDTKWQIFGGVSAVKQAMQLICLLSAELDKGPAPAGGKALLERFAMGVAEYLMEHGVADEDAAESLAVAAAALGSQAFNDSLVALLSQFDLILTEMKACLAAVAAARPPALQQRMMEAVMGSVLPGGKLSAKLERDACRVLVSALCGGPPHLPVDLVEPLLDPFATALLAHEGCPSILREVLQEEAVQALAADVRISPLVKKRMGLVEAWTAHGPPGSWEQPGAWLPELPDIQAFLRGPEKEMKVGHLVFLEPKAQDLKQTLTPS